MAENDPQSQQTVLAQASLLQQMGTQQNNSLSQPTLYRPTPAEAQVLQNIISNPPTPTAPNTQFVLPSSINDVGGQKGNGYASADDAARAVAKPLQAYTQASGDEAGAWIVSKQVGGSDRFFVVAPMQGQGREIQPQDTNSAIESFKRNDTNSEYTVVTNIHSHPLGRRQANGVEVVMEGPSSSDFRYWGGANLNGFTDTVNPGNTYFTQSKGYVVSADGDVYRMDFKDLKQLPRSDLGDMVNGRFTQSTMPTLSRIGDVTPTAGDDNALKPNVREAGSQVMTLPNGQRITTSNDWLPQSQVIDTVKLLSDSTHPDNKMYNQALQAINALDLQKVSFANVQEKENAAAAMVYEAKRNGLGQIDHITASKDGKDLFAIQGALGDPAALITRPGLDKAQAVTQSVEASSERILNDSPNFPAAKLPTVKSDNINLDQPTVAASRSM